MLQQQLQQWRSYTRVHTGLGPGKSFQVNIPEPSGVARNGANRARLASFPGYWKRRKAGRGLGTRLGPDHTKIKLTLQINNYSSLFQVAI